MARGIPFVLIAAVAGGLWSVLVSRASREVNPFLGPVIAESTGVVIGLMLLAGQMRQTALEYSTRGILLLLLAGACVFSVDYFNLRAYGSELPVSVGAPIFLGGTIMIASVAGFFLGEGISARKLFGIGLVLAGVVLLGSLSE
jgi:transporter family protein